MTLELTPPRLTVHTVEIPDPGRLVDLLPRTDAYAWIRRGDGIVGWGEVARHKPSSMGEAAEWWADLVSHLEVTAAIDFEPAGAGFVAFGSFVFDPDATAAPSVLVVPATVVGRRNGRSWRTTITSTAAADALPAAADTPTVDASEPVEAPRGVTYADGALNGPEWESVVADAVRRIGAGDLDKVVLARDLLVYAENDIDPRWLVDELSRGYPQCWTYLVDGLVGATPEMLVRLESGLATSRVLAGTIRRSGDGLADLNLGASLSQSSKDLEEHEYAVQSVAGALRAFASGMNVPDAPYVLELPNVLHLATDVTAVADPRASSLQLAAALHPSAAVCGTPTESARSLIAEIEHLDRERYAGPVGWIDAQGDGEWAIALRYGQLDETEPRQIRLYAGCGIVAGSDPAAELAESNAKLIPMRDALGG